MELPQDGRRRAFIEQVHPDVDCGRAALKRVLGETIEVRAAVLAEGHERIACVLLHAPTGSENWIAVPMVPREEDVWQASFSPAKLGRHRYTVAAWIDAFGTWRQKFARRAEPDDIELALREGAAPCSPTPARSRATRRSRNAARAR